MSTSFDDLAQRISRSDAKLGETIRRVERNWATGDPEDVELTELISVTLMSCIDNGLFSTETMVRGFNVFSDEFFERQLDSLRSGAYRAKDYETVRRESYAASPNYRHILRSLGQVLVNWKARGVSRIVDIASGHGLLLLYALRTLGAATGVSVDISPVAARFASSLQRTTGWGMARFSSITKNLLASQPSELYGPFDAAICCELLEHIPNPEAFLERIGKCLVPHGRMFVSAAVRMESVDHLTYFATTTEVSRLIEDAGFAVLSEMSVPFVTTRPANSQKWNRLVADPSTPVTYVAECQI